MASVASAGASSLDINSIVSQLMQIEGRRKTLLQKDEASYQLKLTAVGSLSSAMSSFQSSMSSLRGISSFQGVNATSGDTDVFTATAASTAAPGTYNIEVTQIAKANMLTSPAQADISTAIGEGTLAIQVGSGASVNVTIDSTNSSLAGIRDAINDAGTDVTASIINDGTGYKLLMTSDNMGSSNTIKVTATGADLITNFEYDPSGTQNMTEIQAAQSSQIKLGTLTINKDSNSISDVVPGVTLNLKKTQVGTPVSLTVANDTSVVSNNVNTFVTAFNSLVTTLDSLGGYDADTKVAGPLSGDGMIRQIEASIRDTITYTIPGLTSGINSLSMIGISTQKDGTLKVDSAKLDSAIASNYADIVKLFAKVGSATDANISMSSSTDATKPGTYAISITQAATRGDFTGGAALAVPLTITASSNDTLNLSIDGTAGVVTLGAGTYNTAADVAAEVQSKINGTSAFKNAGLTVTVTESGGVLTLTSSSYGSTSTVGTISGNAAADLKLDSGTATAGVNVAGTIGGYGATGVGRSLTGSSGTDVEGLSLAITGAATGSRGNITYSVGVAETIYEKMDGWLDSTSGVITTKKTSLNSTIDRLVDAQELEDVRLTAKEESLRKQYVALQVLLDNLSGVSGFLSNQTTGLEKLISG